MIDFRYHLVSIVSIFLALAVGIVLGAGPLQGQIGDTLTAEITRHLETMGVDPALWLHALETPPSQLYYLTPEELQTYRLATAVDGEPAA